MKQTIGTLASFLTGGATWDYLRDTFVADACNLLITRVASEQYARKLSIVIEHGMTEAEAGRVPGLAKKEREL